MVVPQKKPQSEAFSPPVEEMLALSVAVVLAILEAAEVVRIEIEVTVGADGVTGSDAVLAELVPTALVALTVKV